MSDEMRMQRRACASRSASTASPLTIVLTTVAAELHSSASAKSPGSIGGHAAGEEGEDARHHGEYEVIVANCLAQRRPDLNRRR